MTELPPWTDNAPDQSPPDHAIVVVHPPVLWVLLVAAGYGLDSLLPLPFMPAGFPAAWVGGGVWLTGFVLAGLAIALNSLWILSTLVPFSFVIRYGVVAREEAYLERKFGDAYLAYKARVRRWI